MSTFFASHPISANRYWKVARNMIYISAEAKAYKQEVAWAAKVAGVRLSDAPMAVGITYHPRITKKAVASKTRLDLDNVIKIISDAMNGVAWMDDSQVVEISAGIGAPITDGGVTITIGEAVNHA